jgi:endonuclease YncB( thermonuclease family)
VFLVATLLLLPLSLAAETVEGKVVGVTDGDTLTVLVDQTQLKVRLAEIDTPERGQPWGARAKQALSDLVFGRSVKIEVQDTDRYGRAIARLHRDGLDVNRTLVRQGHAWVYRQYSQDASLLEDENDAHEARRGLWSLPQTPTPPWEWRRAAGTPARAAPAGRAFTCGSKRYCRDMKTCDEAVFHLKRCGLQHLDADRDGVPCESLCR